MSSFIHIPQRSSTLGLRLFLVVLILGIFSKELATVLLFDIEYDLVAYTLPLLLFSAAILLGKFTIYKPVKWIAVICALSFTGTLYLNGSYVLYFKQFIPILIIAFAYSYLFTRYRLQVILDVYVKVAILAALIGLVQVIAKVLFAIKIFTDYSVLDLDSIAREPSHYAVIVLPAFVYVLFTKQRISAFILGLSLVLTFKMTTILAFAAIVLVRFSRWYYYLILLPVCYVGYLLMWNYPEFAYRFENMQKYMESGSLEGVYGTIFSLMSNVEVMYSNLLSNPLTGAGLGGHEVQYFRRFSEMSSLPAGIKYQIGLNAKSAHSLLVRIPSELGLLGTFVFIRFIYSTYKLTITSRWHYAVFLSGLSHFFGKALKLGGYFDYGSIFFLLLMYYAVVHLSKVEKSMSI